MKSHHYWKQVDAFKGQLREAIPHEELKALHGRSAPRHLAYAARQFGIIAVCSVGLWHFSNPLVFVPLAILQGFTFFNMTTLLHEVVHESVFGSHRPRGDRALGLLYAITSGISASQFTRWHVLLRTTDALWPPTGLRPRANASSPAGEKSRCVSSASPNSVSRSDTCLGVRSRGSRSLATAA